MMDVKWIRTDKLYRQLLNTPDLEQRRQIYREQLITPWQRMMSMFGQGDNDDFAGARAWAWTLPEDLEQEPEVLRKLEAANAWQQGEAALRKAVSRFAGRELPFAEVEGWLIVANPERADPVMRGQTGAVDWYEPRCVVQYDTVTEENLPRLQGTIVHEFHHLVRLRLFPWDMMKTSVADYIIHEGLAESFAASLYGEQSVGFFITEFDEAELETARQLIGAGLDKTGFNTLRAYIFGDYWTEKGGAEGIGMPLYGGYTVGYRTVQAFLERTGATVEEATFLPAGEIVEGSGYF